jgi:probable HAF family extracellular repeat protein
MRYQPLRLKSLLLVFTAILVSLWTNHSLLFAQTAPAPPSFQLVPTLGSDPKNAPLGISGDGSTVVGQSYNGSVSQAFRWTSANGTVGLGFVPGFTNYSYATAVNSDGTVIVGGSENTTQAQSFYWTPSGGIVGLGFPAGETANIAKAVTPDGSIVVGFHVNSNVNLCEAYYWSASNSFQGLGTLPGDDCSVSTGVSADGSVIVGISTNSTNLTQQAFRWTRTGGMVGLGFLPNDTVSAAFGVSTDGSVVVGFSGTTSAGHAFRWTAASGMISLGGDGVAYAVNADGSVVVGTSSDSSLNFFPDNHAFRWTPFWGMESLETLLGNAGTNPNHQLTSATAISADGSTIAGIIGFNTNEQAWIATVPVGLGHASTHDFNSDGKSDILWLDASGNVAMWLINASQVVQAGTLGNVGTNWSVVGQRNFNISIYAGGGVFPEYILWRDTSGNLAFWWMGGKINILASGIVSSVPTNWNLYGTGDLDRDGVGDLLWRDDQGNIAIWLMNRGLSVASTASLGQVATSWTIVGGDNRGVIFWRDTAGDVAIWQVNGSKVLQSISLGNVPISWVIAGYGDFNGDGNTDILWRDTNSGTVGIWFLNGSEQVQSTANLGVVTSNWTIVQTGDYNGDGFSDILWRDTSGNLAAWFMSGAQISSTASYGNVPTTWQVQSANAE